MEFFPSIILGFIGVFAPCFKANNFIYFQGFILSYMLLGQTRKCVTNIARVCFFIDRNTASLERFLAEYLWDLATIQRCLLSLLQDKLKGNMLIHGAYLAIVDTTLISKVKGKMAGVQKWHDHSGNPERGDRLMGHHWAIVFLMGFGIFETIAPFPILANLISGQLNPLGFIVNPAGDVRLMSFWDTVCPLLAQLQSMLEHQPMRVVADAYFSKASFINWMLSLNIKVITRMRFDAVGWDDPLSSQPSNKKHRGRKSIHPKKGKKWKLSLLLKAFPLETVSVTVYSATKKMQIVCRDLWIRGVDSQKVRIVVVKTKTKHIILLSTDLNLAKRILIM